MPEHVEDLFQQAVRGDREAFGELAEHSRPRLVRVIETRLGEKLRTRIEAEEVAQEAFTRGFRALATLEWRGEAAFFRWLVTIAERVLLEEARTTRRRPTVPLKHDVAGDAASPSRILRRGERLDNLEEAFSRLPPEYRRVLSLSRLEGLKAKEIAERLGRSPEAVKKLLSRALQKLRETLGDTESLTLPDGGSAFLRGCFETRSVGPRPCDAVPGKERRRRDRTENIVEEERRSPGAAAAGRSQDGVLKQPLEDNRPDSPVVKESDDG